MPQRYKDFLKLLSAIIISLLCCYGAYKLFMRSAAEARWNVSIDRAQAINRAIAYAPGYGFKIDPTSANLETDYDSEDEFYLSKKPASTASHFMSSVGYEIKFKNIQSKDSTEVTLNSQSKLINILLDIEEKKAPPPPGNINQSRSLAETTARKFLGIYYNLFKPAEAVTDNEGDKFRWSVNDEYLNLSYVITIRNEKLTAIKRDTSYTAKFRNDFNASKGIARSYLSKIDAIFFIPFLMIAILFYITGIAQKRINHRLTLGFGAIVFITSIMWFLLSGNAVSIQADFDFGASLSQKILTIFVTILVMTLVLLMFTVFAYVLYAAGLSQGNVDYRKRCYDLELLLRGQIFNKRVITSVLIGLLTSGILMLSIYLPAILYNNQQTIKSDKIESIFQSFSPYTYVIAGSFFLVLTIFVFLSSIISKYIKYPAIGLVVLYVVSFTTLVADNANTGPVIGVFISSALTAIILTYIYIKFGVLAVFLAEMSKAALIASYTLLAQPLQSFQNSGINIIFGLSSLFIVSLIALSKARTAPEIDLTLNEQQPSSDRERLKAEFELAAQAQSKLLPKSFPQIKGFDIAALCKPAGEVGGDLYDFIYFNNNKLGIVVADVSGKGVPASLYMTFTKGLIDSVSEETDDPGEILREVNKRLFDVCGRKMFVTLFMGIIDPVSRQMTYARAGHNPTIYCNNNELNSTTTLLKSPGIGLGMNGGKLFDSVLKVQSLNLKPNDTLLFYSDGITEAMNEVSEEYGEEQLVKIISNTNGHTAEQVLNAVMTDVNRHLNGNNPQDDQTLVAVKVH